MWSSSLFAQQQSDRGIARTSAHQQTEDDDSFDSTVNGRYYYDTPHVVLTFMAVPLIHGILWCCTRSVVHRKVILL